MNLMNRVKAPTPKFFKVLRTVGSALAAIGGTLLAAPVALPVAITTIAGYLAVTGGVISAVSQLTTSPLAPEGGTKEGPFDSAEGNETLKQVQGETLNKPRDGD